MPVTERDRREYFDALQDSVTNFMHQAGQRLGRFDAGQVSLYTGLQMEELAEKVEAITEGALTPSVRNELETLSRLLHVYGNEFKKGRHVGAILRSDHCKLIDADFDLAWVSIGALNSTSPDPSGAIAHGTYTNLDKFRNGCIKDANGKVQKPADWQPPNFEPYTDKLVRD
jgi:predicted HAD superfamily Cof-like phosphohydrolase